MQVANRTLLQQRKQIIAWSFYDWANSAFPTLVTTFIFATYFTRMVAKNTFIGTAMWGDATAIAALVIAILGPILGAITDRTGRRKPWIAVFSLVTIMTTTMLWWIKPAHDYAYIMLVLVILGTIGFELATVFYNAMLPSLAPPQYLGRVSGWAWGFGYAGGLACLLFALLAFVQTDHPLFNLNLQQAEQIRICGPLIALWFFIFAIPLFLFVADKPAGHLSASTALREGLNQLWTTLRTLPQQQTILRFLVARMI